MVLIGNGKMLETGAKDSTCTVHTVVTEYSVQGTLLYAVFVVLVCTPNLLTVEAATIIPYTRS